MSVVALTAIAFLYQNVPAGRFTDGLEWDEDSVAVVETVGGKISEFRPWHGSSVPRLTTARHHQGFS